MALVSATEVYSTYENNPRWEISIWCKKSTYESFKCFQGGSGCNQIYLLDTLSTVLKCDENFRSETSRWFRSYEEETNRWLITFEIWFYNSTEIFRSLKDDMKCENYRCLPMELHVFRRPHVVMFVRNEYLLVWLGQIRVVVSLKYRDEWMCRVGKCFNIRRMKNVYTVRIKNLEIAMLLYNCFLFED